jgi:membrane-associated protein
MLEFLGRLTDTLEGLAESPWLWLVVFIVSALDALLPFMPSDTTMIVVGVLVVPEPEKLLLLVIVGAIGCFAGDILSFTIGRRSGPVLLNKMIKTERGAQRRRWAEAQLWRHGPLLIMVSRYIPAGRMATNVTAGALHYPVRKFIAIEVVATTLWSAFFALLGYAGGTTFREHPAIGMMVAFGVVTILGLLIEFGRRWIAKRKARRAQADASVSPIRGKGLVENTTSTDTSKYSAMRSAR